MAPKRPPSAHLITEASVVGVRPARGGDELIGVLICRAEGSEAQTMAIRALEIDAGWEHDEAIATIMGSLIEPGRWFKVPDRDTPHSWIMIRAGAEQARAGATPGVLFNIRRARELGYIG